MLKIRLMRIGGRQRPFYRVVAVDERAKRTGGYIELLGTYNPLTSPHEIILKQDRIDHWVKQGAQMSTGFLRIIGKAPQRPPRKPKKESKQGTVNSEQVAQPTETSATIEQPTSDTPTTETPTTEEVKAPESVIASTSTELSVNSAKQSNQDENPTQIATVAPEGGPRNDKVEEKGEKKDERPA